MENDLLAQLPHARHVNPVISRKISNHPHSGWFDEGPQRGPCPYVGG
jgi:hypothetical protein